VRLLYGKNTPYDGNSGESFNPSRADSHIDSDGNLLPGAFAATRNAIDPGSVSAEKSVMRRA
jgi:hypothetical protein